ncbi:DoxX family protein [Sphingobacterium sp. 1.A.5]|uniref:DoxX family protein n=1 Tax=Sphingobacterium sp. 1.A.5 TaxID=2044604 RepID=UPI000C0C0645|nr:DoxX family protein [Sphingobacterium sp. 1.A.5]
MKRIKIYYWLSTTFIFLFEAIMPLTATIFAPDQYNAGTKPLGYPDYFAISLIVCKIIGATALMIPRLNPKIKEWAYAGLAFNLFFAALSHIIVDGNIGYILMPIVVGIILAISYINNEKLKNYGKNEF